MVLKQQLRVMLQDYTDNVYKSGVKEGLKRAENIRELLPLILRMVAFLLSVLVLIQPLAILFLAYPILDLTFQFLNSRYANKDSILNVADLDGGPEEA